MNAQVGWQPSTPRRVAAIFTSLLLPGAGQVLLGEPRWALLWFVLPLLAMGLVPSIGTLGVALVLLARLGSGVHSALMRGKGPPVATRTAVLMVALVLGTFTAMASLRHDVVESVSLPTASMFPALLAGDYVVVDKAAYGWRVPFTSKKVSQSAPRVGDVVAIEDAEHAGQLVLGRLVAAGPSKVGVVGGGLVIGEVAVERRAVEGATCSYLTVTADGKFVDEACLRFDETVGGKTWGVVQAVEKAPMDVAAVEVPEGSVAVVPDNRGGEDVQVRVVKADAVRGKAVMVWFSTGGPRGVRWGRMGEKIR